MDTETRTCVSACAQAIPVSNFKCLFGAHERLLNNLVKRFDEGLIDDFYVYASASSLDSSSSSMCSQFDAQPPVVGFAHSVRNVRNVCTVHVHGLRRACSYFREAWALAVFHDRFVNLRAELRQLLATAAPNGTGPAVDGDRERAEEDTAAGSVEEFARRLLDEDILVLVLVLVLVHCTRSIQIYAESMFNWYYFVNLYYNKTTIIVLMLCS